MSLKTRAVTLALAAIVLLAGFPPLGTLHASPLSISAQPSRSAPTHALELLAGVLAVGMAIRVKDAAAVARKWATRAGAASTDYKEGVAQAAGDWEQNALAGAGNYGQGVQQAIADARYEKGIRAAGGAKFAQRATQIGATRYAPGVQASEGEMAKAVGPVLQTIASINLPPRRPKGDPGNMERANAVAVALRKLKTGR